MPELLALRPEGLYCAAGDFYIDPWRPVERAVLTHGHADHARTGHGRYFLVQEGLAIARHRLGAQQFCTSAYGESFALGRTAQPVRISFHPAGHILGSAQVRVEYAGEVWVVSGDYKRTPDPTCAAFEPVPCDVFISEATFALPIYRWPSPALVAAQIHQWWQRCAASGITAVLCCYALGKAQRILAELRAFSSETVYLHGAMIGLVDIYREAGVDMVPTAPVPEKARGSTVDLAGALVLAPPSAIGSPWMQRFRRTSNAFASGWMQVRGRRRMGNYQRGFVLSDHADWDGLLLSVRESRARRVLITHGHGDALVRLLQEQGLSVATLATELGNEGD